MWIELKDVRDVTGYDQARGNLEHAARTSAGHRC